MKNELKEYIGNVRSALSQDGTELDKLMASMRVNIGFFQHERLIHLIVTALFAVLVLLSLLMSVTEIYFLPLFVLFLALEIPYIFHYYKLENGVQELQRLYRKAEEMRSK